jgi:hypothetical protein
MLQYLRGICGAVYVDGIKKATAKTSITTEEYQKRRRFLGVRSQPWMMARKAEEVRLPQCGVDFGTRSAGTTVLSFGSAGVPKKTFAGPGLSLPCFLKLGTRDWDCVFS